MSEAFARTLYGEMQKTISLDELREYLTVLLEINGRGPSFAWAFFLNNTVPHNVLIDILRRFPDALKLRFVYPYLFSEVSGRRRHAPSIRLLIKDISDKDAAMAFIRRLLAIPSPCLSSVLGRTGRLLYDFVERLDLAGEAIRRGLSSTRPEAILDGALFAGAFGRISRLYPFLAFLSADQPESLRLGILDVIARSAAEGDGQVQNALTVLLGDDLESVTLKTFSTLIALDAPELVTLACGIIEDRPALRLRLYKCLAAMKGDALIRVLDRLPEAQSLDARRTLSRVLVRKNPEKIDVLFGYYKTDPDEEIRQAAETLFDQVESIRLQERKTLLRELSPAPPAQARLAKQITPSRMDKLLKQIADHQGEKKLDLRGEVFSDLDLTGMRLAHLDLREAVFVNCDLSSAQISACLFRGAALVNLTMNHVFIDGCDFQNAVFDRVEAGSSRLDRCLFHQTAFHETRLDFSDIQNSYFTGADFVKCDLSRSDLSLCSFAGARMGLSDFSYCPVFRTDFDQARATLCTFTGTCFAQALISGETNLDERSDAWDALNMPPLFFEKKLLDSRWMNILILTDEMDRQREIFIRHNEQARERALDAFRAEQADLFELVPLLIHLTQRILPIEKKSEDSYLTENMMLKNASSGISNYTPSPKTVRLARKYLRVDKLLLLPGKECHIEALFTIGSVGTIAQSAESDLDYWVCVDRNRMGPDAVALLTLKLESIERWARQRFGTELHFFVVDPENVREGRFGGSDFESSGSAQGMILKEEFYRTMILVAGKIPFWNVLPVWTDNRYYPLLHNIASRFHDDYLDLGNVGSIPAGEYFGASMWQLFKSLTSPYKSVMKMALLEKYIEEGKKGLLLCNRLKRRWATGKSHVLRQDPYLLLFDEVSDFYRQKGQDDIAGLVKLCFFLKLSVRSEKQLDQSVFGMRKQMVEECMSRYGWDRNRLYDLGHFDEWPYDKVLDLSGRINGFMIDTYQRLSSTLNHSPVMETMITSKDLTILGRKMFVQFSDHPFKVKTLPHVARGRNLFKQLFLYYRKAPRTEPVWDVFPFYDKKAMTLGNDWAVLRNVAHIEEVAAWVVHNGIYQSGTRFTILPNPSSVSAQDFQDLLKDMNDFFVFGEGDAIPPTRYLETFTMARLFIVANFTLERKSDRMIEFTAVYMTSWGEMFCRSYTTPSGLSSPSEAVDWIENDLGLSCRNIPLGGHMPRLSRKPGMELL
jgi:adenylate cyclase class 1